MQLYNDTSSLPLLLACLQGLQEYDSIFQGRFSKALQAAGAHIANQYDTYLICHPLSGPVPWMQLKGRHSKEQPMSAVCSR
jgi:hypothetical protein